MDQVLHTQELVQLVVDNLPRSSLPSLALAARHFQIPAVSRIWKSLDQRTIQCLLNMIIGEDDAEADPHLSMATRWRRFNMYASFARHLRLDLHRDNTSGVHQRANALASLRQSIYLLPNLQTLHVCASEPQDLDCASLFLSSSLTEITVECPGQERHSNAWDLRIVALLYRIQEEVPGLKKLSLLNMPRLVRLSDAVEGLLSNLFDLVTFHADETLLLLRDALTKLSRLPKLCELKIDKRVPLVNPPFNAVALSASIDDNSFPSLRKLDLCCSITVASALLSSMRTDLQTFLLKSLSDTFGPRHLIALAANIRDAGPNLQKLHFTLVETDAGSRDILPWDAFAGVLQCHFIKEFHFLFSSRTPLDLRDCHVDAMARSWPSLTSLSVRWKRPHLSRRMERRGGLADETAFTLGALRYLALDCTDIRDVNFASIHAAGDVPMPPPVQPVRHRVKLAVDQGEITDSDAVALYLHALWPNLKLYRPANEVWTKAQHTLSILRSSRAIQNNPQMMLSMRNSSLRTAMGRIREMDVI